MTYIIFRLLCNLFDLCCINLCKAAKYWDSFLSNCSTCFLSSIPFFQHFPTIGNKIMSVLNRYHCQRARGKKGFTIVGQILDAVAWWPRGWGGMGWRGLLKMASLTVTFDTARLYQISAEHPQRELMRCKAMRQHCLTTRFCLLQRVVSPPCMSEGSPFVSPLLEPDSWLRQKMNTCCKI